MLVKGANGVDWDCFCENEDVIGVIHCEINSLVIVPTCNCLDFYSSYSLIMLPYSSFENDFTSFRKSRVLVKINIIVAVIVSISIDWSELSSNTKILQLAGRGFQVITLHTTLYPVWRDTKVSQITCEILKTKSTKLLTAKRP